MVNAGEIVPVDGVIIHGAVSVDQHMLTGEAQPVEKEVGDQILAGTMALSGRINIDVSQSGSATVAAQIGTVLNQTAMYQHDIQTRGEAIADKSVLPTLGFSAVALGLLGPTASIAIVFSNYSEVLRIAAPIGMLNFLEIASNKGILIKDGRSLELLKNVDTFVFDKTGTLTLERPSVGQVRSLIKQMSRADVLTYAAAAEYKQTHPIAKAILKAAKDQHCDLPDIDDATYEVGYGVKIKIEKETIQVGSAKYMEKEGTQLSLTVREIQDKYNDRGSSLVFVAKNKKMIGFIEIQSTTRPEAKSVINELKKRGYATVIISGDHEKPTSQLTEQLEVDEYYSGTLPEAKAAIISNYQDKGRSICFIVDGLNDSIALKQANVSISMSNAPSLAKDYAQIIFMDQNLKQIEQLMELAKGYDENIKRTFDTTFIPGLFCIAGVFLFRFSIFTSFILYNTSLLMEVGNAMAPRFKRLNKNPE